MKKSPIIQDVPAAPVPPITSDTAPLDKSKTDKQNSAGLEAQELSVASDEGMAGNAP